VLDAKSFFRGAGLLANHSRFTFLDGKLFRKEPSRHEPGETRYEKRETRQVSDKLYLRAPACASASGKEES